MTARQRIRPPADASSIDRVPFVDRRFSDLVAQLEAAAPRGDLDGPIVAGSQLTGRRALELFSSQLVSRHLDLRARELKREGRGYYTIGSSGHEGNAAVAAALDPHDPALLHYRSGAFFIERARMAGYPDAALDVLLGVVASSDEPIAGGRHKVFGSLPLAIPPQTSTIGSHLPKAVGMAFTLERARQLKIALNAPADAIVMCSFGDASINHSTAIGAINAACWAAYRGSKVPILFVCEDNGIGISVPTPHGWIAESVGAASQLRYFEADGLELPHAYDQSLAAVDFVRRERRPALLHLRVVRLLGHAGSDIEPGYLTIEQIERREARDPVLRSAQILVAAGLLTPEQVLTQYEHTRDRVADDAATATRRPQLTRAEQVVGPLARLDHDAIAQEVSTATDEGLRTTFWRGKLPERERAQPLNAAINRALGDLLLRYPEMVVFGEDVAQKGGVYGVTRDLYHLARRGRVFDTLLDEQTILGTAIGAGQLGLLPVAEIQYLAYLHNAEDQLRGEAASQLFFSQGQFKNPMVVRIASYAYQKGFGGHFHNDNSVAVLRDIPGLVIASPARGDDAAAMLRTCVAAAKRCDSVCVFLEPIALYATRDLHEPGDGLWCSPYAPDGDHVPVGVPRIYHPDARDLLVVTWANGLWMSLRVAKRLRERLGICVRVLDLRWLAPLPAAALVEQANAVGKVLVVDETRKSGGVSEAVFAALVDGGYRGPLRRVSAMDCFIPLGEAANLVLVQETDIEEAALAMAD